VLIRVAGCRSTHLNIAWSLIVSLNNLMSERATAAMKGCLLVGLHQVSHVAVAPAQNMRTKGVLATHPNHVSDQSVVSHNSHCSRARRGAEKEAEAGAGTSRQSVREL
jgi:hypothetical protein